jgi:hypothetical protein
MVDAIKKIRSTQEKGGLMAVKTQPLVWVKDNAGNRFLCPLDALVDPNSLSEKEKMNCVDDASKLKDPKSVKGEGKIKYFS